MELQNIHTIKDLYDYMLENNLCIKDEYDIGLKLFSDLGLMEVSGNAESMAKIRNIILDWTTLVAFASAFNNQNIDEEDDEKHYEA